MKINKGQFFFSWKKHLQFSYRRAQGHLWGYLKNRFKWHFYPRLRYVSPFPDHVDVELASNCDMKCPMCYTTTDLYKQSVSRRLMRSELFKKVIDECARYGVYSIRLSLRGEPFLHKEIAELICYAKEKGIKEVATLTNGLRLNPELFVRVMKAGLDWLTISFDGMGETYNHIRAPAKFEEAVEKIKIYSRLKKQYRSVKPVIKIQAVWPSIKDCAQEFYDLFEPYVDSVASNPLIDYLHSSKEIEYEENFVCPVLYQRLVIGSDGKVLLCSNDEFGRYLIGDASTESLYHIWHGPRMSRARELHLKRVGYKELDPCKDCYLPRKTTPTKEKVGEREITIDKYTNLVEVIH